MAGIGVWSSQHTWNSTHLIHEIGMAKLAIDKILAVYRRGNSVRARAFQAVGKVSTPRRYTKFTTDTRRVKIGTDLYYEYQIDSLGKELRTNSEASSPNIHNDTIGTYVSYEQSRLTGSANPLRPPFHSETVLIGRALSQRSGYLYGVGYRVRDDGMVEAEFADGLQVFELVEEFESALNRCVNREQQASYPRSAIPVPDHTIASTSKAKMPRYGTAECGGCYERLPKPELIPVTESDVGVRQFSQLLR